MFYNKLQGTTSSSFRLGKNGVNIETLQGGELRIVTKDYEFLLGKSEVEGLFEGTGPRTVASWQVVENYIIEELEEVVGDLTGIDEALQQISGLAAAIDNDPDFYNNVLRLNDKVGEAVDGQIVKGTTTFEKDITLGGKIIGPSTLVIDPLLTDSVNPSNTNLGTVVIHGNLQVDGTTTTINSQTVEIFDKNITLAAGSLNDTASNGAGITIDLGTDGTANLTYLSSTDSFNLNKDLNVNGTINADKFTSTVATGTAPLTVTSTTLVTNLNADKFDGADLETSLTNNSDEKVPTSKAVGDYSVPRQLSILQNSVSYDSSLETNQKNNSYMYIYDNSGESGVAKRISVSEIHRPSAYIQKNQAQIVTAVKAGDFIYEEI